MTDDGKTPVKTEVVRDLLLLCGVSVPVEIVAAQTPGDRGRATRWAAATHLSASDNDNVVPGKPQWVSLFEVLDADPDPAVTAGDRWAGHMARVEGGQRRVPVNEGVTMSLAQGVVMAQQIMIARMRERFAAALAIATAYGEAAGAPEHELARVIDQMTRELLGTDEAHEEFRARFGGERREGGRP